MGGLDAGAALLPCHKRCSGTPLPWIAALTPSDPPAPPAPQVNVWVGPFFVLSGYMAGYTATELGKYEASARVKPAWAYTVARVAGFYPLFILVQAIFAPMFAFADATYNGPWATAAHALMSAGLVQVRAGAGVHVLAACVPRLPPPPQAQHPRARLPPMHAHAHAPAHLTSPPARRSPPPPRPPPGLVPGARRDLERAHLVPVGPGLCHAGRALRAARHLGDAPPRPQAAAGRAHGAPPPPPPAVTAAAAGAPLPLARRAPDTRRPARRPSHTRPLNLPHTHTHRLQGISLLGKLAYSYDLNAWALLEGVTSARAHPNLMMWCAQGAGRGRRGRRGFRVERPPPAAVARLAAGCAAAAAAVVRARADFAAAAAGRRAWCPQPSPPCSRPLAPRPRRNHTRFHPFYALVEVLIGVAACRLVMIDGVDDEGKPTGDAPKKPGSALLPALGLLGITYARAAGYLPLNDPLTRVLLFVPLFTLLVQRLHRQTVAKAGGLSAFLSQGWLTYLGALSFPIFIVHGPIGQLFYKKVGGAGGGARRAVHTPGPDQRQPGRLAGGSNPAARPSPAPAPCPPAPTRRR